MRPVRNAVALVATGIILAWLLAACGASARQKTINTTFSATNAAAEAFVKYDAAHQIDLATHAPDEGQAKAALSAWRIDQQKVERYLAATYQAIAAAAIADNDSNFQGMVEAALQLSELLRTLGVHQ